MMQHHRHMRGQTLPLWLGTALLTIVFAFFVGSYGNVVAYQFRAQAAADSAASAAVAIQSQEFNQMTQALYATGVEEYRIRHLLEAIRITAVHGGGCNRYPFGSPNECHAVWSKLIPEYRKSVTRYSIDAQILNRITNTMNLDTERDDAQTLVDQMNKTCDSGSTSEFKQSISCDTAAKQLHYTLDWLQIRPDNISNVFSNAQVGKLPSFATGLEGSVSNRSTFYPIAAQVTVCSVVPQIFPAFFGLFARPTVVVARGAATNVMVEQDWIQPGNSHVPNQTTDYQNIEKWGGTDAIGASWYNVNFGGNASITVNLPGPPPVSAIGYKIENEEFSAQTGWWGPMSVMPFHNVATTDATSKCHE